MGYLTEASNLIHTAQTQRDTHLCMEEAHDNYKPDWKRITEAHHRRLRTILHATTDAAIQSALRYPDSEVVRIIQRALDENEESLTIPQNTKTLGVGD